MDALSELDSDSHGSGDVVDETKFFEINARSGGPYRVFVDGVEQSGAHVQEREAAERCSSLKFANPLLEVLYRHDYEAEIVLTNQGVTLANFYNQEVDLPPTITSTPAPIFTEGIADSYDMTQHVVDDGLSPVVYTLSNILPNGLVFFSDTGILTYDGIADLTVSSHQLTATDAVGSAQSDLFNISVVEDAPPIITSTPNPRFAQGAPATYDMGLHFTDDGISTVTSNIPGSLPPGITYNGNTHILTYDGSGPINVWPLKVLEVTDGFNPTVTSSTFTVEIFDTGSAQPELLTDLALWSWDHDTDPLWTIKSPLSDNGVLRVHRESGGVGSRSIVDARDTSPLKPGGGPYLHTRLTHAGGTPANPIQSKRCERHPYLQYITGIPMTDELGDGHRSNPDDWWYAIRMRINASPDDIFGAYNQWHDQGNQIGAKQPAVFFQGNNQGLQLNQLTMPGGNRTWPFVITPPFVGRSIKLIWRIRWDTHDFVELGQPTTGRIRLYLDDDPVPVYDIIGGRTAHPPPDTVDRAPFWKFGLYKSPWQHFGALGDVCDQDYDDMICIKSDPSVTDMRASIAAWMDLDLAGNPGNF